MSLNKVMLIGNVGKEVDVKNTPNTTIARLSLATSEKYLDAQGQRQQRTEWHNVVCFGKLADVCAQYVTKGAKIYVEGKIKSGGYTDNEGNKRRSYDINAQSIQFLDSSNKQGGQQVQTRQAPQAPQDSFDDDIPF